MTADIGALSQAQAKTISAGKIPEIPASIGASAAAAGALSGAMIQSQDKAIAAAVASKSTILKAVSHEIGLPPSLAAVVASNLSILEALSFEIGLPSSEFYAKAWASEPLTAALQQVNLLFALPPADHEKSKIAVVRPENKPALIIGQCSANEISTYWNHISSLNLAEQNKATHVFVAIHAKAVSAEQEYLKKLGISPNKVIHNAGIAVLPEYRGKGLGIAMMKQQMELSKKLNRSFLFCETTNRYSAEICRKLGFTEIASYPYKTLASELHSQDLLKINDSFTVWGAKI